MYVFKLFSIPPCFFNCLPPEVFGLDNSLFGDEDTVEEFTFVLGSDLADLGDLSARKRDIAVVDAFEDQFVLYFSRELNSSAWLHNDLLDVATT